ncbi:hypothetical protein E4T56_gene19340 [Termitomyces sp. T112]|nr:hypothetical protein E4T56_gene19340 [Termitomyces sp. T112]
MSDKQEHGYSPPPPAYRQSSVNATPSHRSQDQYYGCHTRSYGSAQQPQYHGPPMNNAYLSPCAQGHHASSIRFGLCGILAAIFCFPIGFICMCLDTERVCARCGIRM